MTSFENTELLKILADAHEIMTGPRNDSAYKEKLKLQVVPKLEDTSTMSPSEALSHVSSRAVIILDNEWVKNELKDE